MCEVFWDGSFRAQGFGLEGSRRKTEHENLVERLRFNPRPCMGQNIP